MKSRMKTAFMSVSMAIQELIDSGCTEKLDQAYVVKLAMQYGRQCNGHSKDAIEDIVKAIDFPWLRLIAGVYNLHEPSTPGE